MSRCEAAEVFVVAISTAVKWMQRLRDTGSSAAKPFKYLKTLRSDFLNRHRRSFCLGAALLESGGGDLMRCAGHRLFGGQNAYLGEPVNLGIPMTQQLQMLFRPMKVNVRSAGSTISGSPSALKVSFPSRVRSR